MNLSSINQCAYAYDPGGNRIRVWAGGVQTTANFGDMGEITSFGTDTFTTDHFGNMKTQMVGLNTTTFNWDFESHLTGIDYPGTSSDDSHEYDGNGLRMRSKLNGAADWTNFVWDEVAGNLIAEYTLISGTFTLKSVNGWGVGLLWTNREGTKRYFHFDGSGSTWALTDASQNVTDTYEYTSFGVSIASSGSSVNPFRWMAQEGAYDDGAQGSAQGLLVLANTAFSPAWGTDLPVISGETSPIASAGPGITQRTKHLGRWDLRTTRVCYRPVVGELWNRTLCHWYFETTTCGCIGFDQSGVHVGKDQCAQQAKGYASVCIPIPSTPKKDKCLCDLAKAIKNGWIACGRTWSGDDYVVGGQNCQAFANCLLSKCFGGKWKGQFGWS